MGVANFAGRLIWRKPRGGGNPILQILTILTWMCSNFKHSVSDGLTVGEFLLVDLEHYPKRGANVQPQPQPPQASCPAEN